MGWFRSLELVSLEDLMHTQLQDLYDAELRLLEAIPKLLEVAHSSELTDALLRQLDETRGHVIRLQSIFRPLGIDPRRMTCKAMKGLIAEGNEILSASGDPSVRDAAITANAQRIEHYEIAGYESVLNWAEQLEDTRIAHLLRETLEEEINSNKLFSAIAKQPVNLHAIPS